MSSRYRNLIAALVLAGCSLPAAASDRDRLSIFLALDPWTVIGVDHRGYYGDRYWRDGYRHYAPPYRWHGHYYPPRHWSAPRYYYAPRYRSWRDHRWDDRRHRYGRDGRGERSRDRHWDKDRDDFRDRGGRRHRRGD